jgi:hypothetical protein
MMQVTPATVESTTSEILATAWVPATAWTRAKAWTPVTVGQQQKTHLQQQLC